MREILLIFISSLILPLLKDFLIEIWKDKRNKDKNKKQDRPPAFCMPIWELLIFTNITKFESFVALLRGRFS